MDTGLGFLFSFLFGVKEKDSVNQGGCIPLAES